MVPGWLSDRSRETRNQNGGKQEHAAANQAATLDGIHHNHRQKKMHGCRFFGEQARKNQKR